MRVIDNGITMFQFNYKTAEDLRGSGGSITNWNFIIIGAVILIAVILDQIAHVVQAKRARARSASLRHPQPIDVAATSKG